MTCISVQVRFMPTESGFRKGRGAGSNPEGRFESRRVEAIDDGWPHELADELPPLETTVTAEHAKQRHHAQQLTRHSLRAIDQCVPRLRARLCLLLCPPLALVHEPLAGPGFRNQAFLQSGRCALAGSGAREAGLLVQADQPRCQHGPVPADRAQAPGDALSARGAAAISTSAHHCHQVGAGGAGHRYSRGHGA